MVGLVEFILHLPDRLVKVFGEIFSLKLIKRGTVKHKKIFGLLQMTSGLVHFGYSLPEGQAGKLNFFVPWIDNRKLTLNKNIYISLVFVFGELFLG